MSSTPCLRASVLIVLLAGGCPRREISEVFPDQDRVEIKDIPSTINRAVDILFLVDKSPTMADEQASLAANFPRFVEVLESIEGGLPELHLGVITQDIGAGGYTVGGSCSGAGDGGVLQNTPMVPGCTPPTGQYIADTTDANGNRIRNYVGSLADTFSCIAQVGPDGCGFEQHLAAVELALGGSLTINAGFLRPNAYLALIMISDEDDCSASDPANLFDPASDGGPLGPVSDFRCAEYGWTCDGGAVARAPGSYTECEPKTGSAYLHHPDHYVDFLQSLKSDPALVIVANIIGDLEPITVGPHATSGDMEVKPSCTNGAQNAEPMPRLSYFADQFVDRSAQISICDPNLAAGLDQIAALLARVIGTPCFQTNITQVDLSPDPGLQLECVVSEVNHPGTPEAVETPLPRCAMVDEDTVAPGTVEPCYYIHHAASCSAYPTQLGLEIHPPDRIPPPDSQIHAECVSE